MMLEAKDGKGALEGETCVLKVVKAIQPGGSAERAGVTVGSHLLFVNGASTYYMPYEVK